MRVGWFLIFVVALNLVIGATKTFTTNSNQEWASTPQSTNVNLEDPALTAEGVSGLEQTTYGNAKNTGKMIYDLMINSIIPTNTLPEGGNLTLLLNQGISIIRTLLGVMTLIAMFALIRGWVQF